jgi:hypothetical protein
MTRNPKAFLAPMDDSMSDYTKHSYIIKYKRQKVK